MEFPEQGMSCPVRGCAASTFFKKFDQLRNHWYQFHSRTVQIHKCSVCQATFVKRKDARRHVRQHHLSVLITTFSKVNERYMDPGEVALPRARASVKADPELTPREQAAQQRRILAKRCINSEASALSSRGRGNVPRDHNLTFRPDGGMIATTRSLWVPTSPEQMELDYMDDVADV